MANINAPEIEYYKSFANEIAGKFRRLQSLIGHPGVSGNYHEEIIRSVLRNFLSKRFSVKTGFIYKGPGEVSRQIDIMIIDENCPAAYIFQEEDFAIVMPNAVVAVIEVKTQLNKDSFKLAIENITASKKLTDFPVNLAGIIFGYDGGERIEKSMEDWFKEADVEKSLGLDRGGCLPDVIYCFNKNLLLVSCNREGQIVFGGEYYHWLGSRTGEDNQAIQLSVILATVVNACERKDSRDNCTIGAISQGMSLIQAEKAGISEERLVFGKGLI